MRGPRTSSLSDCFGLFIHITTGLRKTMHRHYAPTERSMGIHRTRRRGPVITGSLRRRAVAAGALVLTGALALSACGDDSGGGAKVPGVKLVESGKIKTCTSLPYPPFQFAQGGKTVGFDVDMIDLAAKRLGVQQEIVDVKFD